MTVTLILWAIIVSNYKPVVTHESCPCYDYSIGLLRDYTELQNNVT